MSAFPIKPYVNSAPVLDEPPVDTDWGMLVRVVGPVAIVVVPGTVFPTREVQPLSSTVTKQVPSLVTVTLAAANANRLGLIVYNDSSTPLYLKVGAGAGLDDYTVKVFMGSYWEAPFPVTTQIITGIWAVAGTGGARTTEMTNP